MQTTDDLGFKVELEGRPRRIVSLVPSWTETLFALGLDREIVGVTRFCVEPAAAVASVPKIGGTKNPNIKAIVELAPNLVIANAEENRRDGAPDCAFRERNRDRQRDVEQASFSRLLSDLEKPVDGIQRRHVCA